MATATIKQLEEIYENLDFIAECEYSKPFIDLTTEEAEEVTTIIENLY